MSRRDGIIARPVVQPKKSTAPYLLGLLARTRRKPTVVRAPYSCDGENKNCYKCYGTGFYDKELTEDAAKSLVASGKKGKPKNGKTSNLGAFASDSRGADYSVREAGKFLSLPLHEDYGDESSS